jgi:hypothetical protein
MKRFAEMDLLQALQMFSLSCPTPAQGLILTAAHIALELNKAAQDAPHVHGFVRQRDAIANGPRLHPNDKRKRLRALKDNPSWITDQAVMWGFTGDAQIEQFHINVASDLAIGRVKPFDPAWVKGYPIFKNATVVRHFLMPPRLSVPPN